MKLIVKKSVTIDKPAEDVWKFLWDDFGDLHKSFSNVKECKLLKEEGTGDKTDGSNEAAVVVDGISGRELAMMDGSVFTERLISVDKKEHILSYNLIGMPLGVPLVGTWRVSPSKEDNTKTELEVEDVVELSYWPPSFIAYPIFSLLMPAAAEGMLEDSKHYIETGEPSPAKAESLKQIKRDENLVTLANSMK